MAGGWEAALLSVFKLIPYVVAGIDTIHANESKETKLQLAQDALSIATQGAAQILSPGDEAIAAQVSSAVSSGITVAQGVVETLKTPATTQAPVESK